MKYSEITLENKENELLETVLSFSRNVIADIDKALKRAKIQNKEAPYIDLMAESFFSIQSFCVLSKEGLVSSSFAIFRIILEQVVTAYLTSNNPVAKRSFVNVKMKQSEYWLAHEADRKQIMKKICSENGIPQSEEKLKRYFDYGWAKSIGCNYMTLKSICMAAKLDYMYDMVDVVINGFAHGFRSIFQLRRNNVDKEAIRTIRHYTFRLFFFLVNAVVTEFGKNSLSDDNQKSYSLSKALFWDIQSRLDEQVVYKAFGDGNIDILNIETYTDQAYDILILLDKVTDGKQKYLLSQAFVRTIRQVVAASAIKKWNLDSRLVKDLNMTNMFNAFDLWDKIKLKSYMAIELPVLLKMLDAVDDDWSLVGNDIDYAFTYSATSLLEALT